MGCLKSPIDLRDYKVAKITKEIDLPDSFSVEISDIKNQGFVSSCVAHAIAEILETFDANNKFSTEWIYGYRPEGYYCGEGMYISQALKTVKNVGYLVYNTLPGNHEMNKAKEIVDEKINAYALEANKRQIIVYAKLRSIKEIKETIYITKKPILMSIEVDESGLKLDKNNVAKLPKSLGGYHAVVCFGWNEQGLLIQNSWGKTWGDNGTFTLPYEYGFSEAWIIKEEEKELEIVKPSVYPIREFIQKIIKLFIKLFSRKYQ